MRGEYSLSDIAAATGNGMGGFGDTGAWWIIIIIILFGWGRNGYGFGGSGAEGASNNYVLASDFATIQRQLSDGFGGVEKGLDTIRNGLCDGFYTNAQLINGVNTNILTSSNNISSQLAEVGFGIKDCCCQELRAIDGINFNNSQNTCAITNAINTGIQSVMTNCNNNFRQLHDEIVANRMEDLREANRQLRDKNASLELSASQAIQTNQIIDTLRPCPSPAYVVPNPFCNCNNGCGCNF